MSCECEDVKIGTHEAAVSVELSEHMSYYRDARVEDGLSPNVSIDKCLVDEIHYLWSMRISTRGSCCGHNQKRGYIAVTEDDVEKMERLGYEHYPHPEQDTFFYAKTV